MKQTEALREVQKLVTVLDWVADYFAVEAKVSAIRRMTGDVRLSPLAAAVRDALDDARDLDQELRRDIARHAEAKQADVPADPDRQAGRPGGVERLVDASLDLARYAPGAGLAVDVVRTAANLLDNDDARRDPNPSYGPDGEFRHELHCIGEDHFGSSCQQYMLEEHRINLRDWSKRP